MLYQFSCRHTVTLSTVDFWFFKFKTYLYFTIQLQPNPKEFQNVFRLTVILCLISEAPRRLRLSYDSTHVQHACKKIILLIICAGIKDQDQNELITNSVIVVVSAVTLYNVKGSIICLKQNTAESIHERQMNW